MNKKKRVIFFVFLTILIVTLVGITSACTLFNKDESVPEKKYAVIFMNGEETVTTCVTAGKERIRLPEVARDGYVFEGWFFHSDADPLTGEKLTEDYFLNVTLSSDVTVYALFSLYRDISIDKTELTLVSGESGPFLQATVLPQEKWTDVTCLSSEANVAECTLSEDGKVTVSAKNAGTAVLTFTHGNKTVECTVTVTKIALDIYLDGQKVDSIWTDSKSYSLVPIPVDPMQYPPEETTEGKYFSGWFLDEEMTKGYSGIETIKNGDVVYGAWKEYSAGDFLYKTTSSGLEITKCVRKSAYIILPSELAGLPVKRLSSTFFNYLNCTYLYLPETIDYISKRKVNSLKNIEVSTDNEVFSSKDGVLYDKQGTVLEFYPTGRTEEKFVVPDGVTSIAYDAFSGCVGLAEVDLNEVTMIGDNVFEKCTKLKNVTFSSDATYIGSYAFFGCTALEEINLPDSLATLRKDAFEDCTSLLSIVLPQGVVKIEEKLFYGCSSLASVEYRGAITSIGDLAFGYCSSLTSVVVPASVTSIGDNPFVGCVLLSEIVVEEGAPFTTVGGALLTADGSRFICFPAAKEASSFVVPTGVEEIDGNAFYGSHLIEITLPESVTEIGGSIFSDCASLASITVPILGENAEKSYPIAYFFGSDEFEGGKKIKQSYTTKNGSNAVMELYLPLTLTSVTFTGSTVGNSAFQDCDTITKVALPNATSISWYAFSNCYALSEVTLGEELTTIEGHAFNGCFSLLSIVIPQSVTKIEAGTFYNANNVTIYCEAESAPMNYKDGWNKTYFGGDFEEVPTYWYSEEEPEGEGLFWHYDDGVPVKW